MKWPQMFRAIIACSLLFFMVGASAQVVITSATIIAGGITPGDTPGYPATISTSGSYKLGSNIGLSAGLPNTHGIDITGSDVVLDLNGFTIAGSNTCTKTWGTVGNSCTGATPTVQELIRITGARVTVRNGNVIGSGGWGIAVDADYAHLEALQVSMNKSDGIIATGVDGWLGSRTGTIMLNVNSILNGGVGVRGPGLGEGDATLKNSSLSDNNGGGLFYYANVSDVIANYNAIYGIRGGRAALSHVTAFNNGGDGISEGAIVRDSVTEHNVTGFTNTSGADPTLYVNSSASENNGAGFQLTSIACYTNIASTFNVGAQISGGVALTGTHVTCP